jgi:hypothetical protein
MIVMATLDLYKEVFFLLSSFQKTISIPGTNEQEALDAFSKRIWDLHKKGSVTNDAYFLIKAILGTAKIKSVPKEFMNGPTEEIRDEVRDEEADKMRRTYDMLEGFPDPTPPVKPDPNRALPDHHKKRMKAAREDYKLKDPADFREIADALSINMPAFEEAMQTIQPFLGEHG